MLDTWARRVLAPALDSAAGTLDGARIPPLALTVAGFVCGVAACVTIGAGLPIAALVLWLANRIFDGLDGPVARRRGADSTSRKPQNRRQ